MFNILGPWPVVIKRRLYSVYMNVEGITQLLDEKCRYIMGT